MTKVIITIAVILALIAAFYFLTKSITGMTGYAIG